MSNLTEKYKKRELKEGAYYVRNEHDVIFTAENYINYDCFNDTKTCDFYNVETNIVEVLAPVPSYEEWKFASEQLNKNGTWYTERSYKELKKENDKLKELLKECRDVAEFAKTIVNKHKWFDEVITKIDEVLK